MDRSYLKQQIRILTILTLFILPAQLLSTPCSALEIMINDRVHINGDTIYLGDIASFNPSHDSRISLLKGIEISMAPRPNADQRINKDLLFYKIGPHISNEKDIYLKVPENLFVHRNAQIISSDMISQIFTEHIISNSSWEPERISFERITVPESLALPIGSLKWEIEERLNNNYIGNISVTINFQVNGKLERKVRVSGRVSVSRDVVRTLKKIRSGETISAGDLSLVTVRCLKFKQNVITDIKDAVGKRAVRTIQANKKVLMGMIEDPPMVEKGDRVIIKAENSEIRITVTGKVLEDGRPGDLIRVVNINSGKELYATVRRPDLVEVSF
jgi:flagella basal body P-ring formation protein FlgA